jgi:hypothetical protein
MWSLLDLLRQNAHWCSPIISSVYGGNLTEICWIQFYMRLIIVVCLNNYDSVFYQHYFPLLEWPLPLLRQFILVSNDMNTFLDCNYCCTSCQNHNYFEFDQNLALMSFKFSVPISSYKARTSDTSCSADYISVCLTSLIPSTFNNWPAVLLLVQNTVGFSRQITFPFLF